MNDHNELFRAFLFCVGLACLLALVGYVLPRPDKAEEALSRIADGLITGSLGFYVGSSRSTQNPSPKE